jgi:MOSC domain-containing protein YiiM
MPILACDRSGQEIQVEKISGTVRSINVAPRVGVRKDPLERGRLIAQFGLEGDAHAGDWHRQVSLLAEESIEKIRQKGLSVVAGDFAENITTSGLDLPALPVGTKLQVGNEAILEVTQIGKVCHTRCHIFYAVGDCVMPREGIFARILVGGDVRVGDDVGVLTADL